MFIGRFVGTFVGAFIGTFVGTFVGTFIGMFVVIVYDVVDAVGVDVVDFVLKGIPPIVRMYYSLKCQGKA